MFMSNVEEKSAIDPECPVHGEEGTSYHDAREEAERTFLRLHQIATLSRNLEGKILTICDAVVVESRQNKAVKDLLRDALREFRFKAESVAGGAGDEFSIGVSTLDIEETEEGFKIPTMLEPKA
jgi:hypothetical protein